MLSVLFLAIFVRWLSFRYAISLAKRPWLTLFTYGDLPSATLTASIYGGRMHVHHVITSRVYTCVICCLVSMSSFFPHSNRNTSWQWRTNMVFMTRYSELSHAEFYKRLNRASSHHHKKNKSTSYCSWIVTIMRNTLQHIFSTFSTKSVSIHSLLITWHPNYCGGLYLNVRSCFEVLE